MTWDLGIAPTSAVADTCILVRVPYKYKDPYEGTISLRDIHYGSRNTVFAGQHFVVPLDSESLHPDSLRAQLQ